MINVKKFLKAHPRFTVLSSILRFGANDALALTILQLTEKFLILLYLISL